MTREERTKLINHLKYNLSIGADYLITDKDVKEIIKALEQEPILDKIRAEIEDLDRFYDNDYFSENRDSMFKCNEVLQIIDKYTESEDDEE